MMCDISSKIPFLTTSSSLTLFARCLTLGCNHGESSTTHLLELRSSLTLLHRLPKAQRIRNNTYQMTRKETGRRFTLPYICVVKPSISLQRCALFLTSHPRHITRPIACHRIHSRNINSEQRPLSSDYSHNPGFRPLKALSTNIMLARRGNNVEDAILLDDDDPEEQDFADLWDSYPPAKATPVPIVR